MKTILLRQNLKAKLRRGFVLLLILLLTTNFRVFTNPDGSVSRWYISAEDPTIWLGFCDETIDFKNNDLPTSDPFYANGTDLEDVLQSVIDDFNDVDASYMRFAKFPDDPNNPGDPEEGDSAFTAEKAKIRTIDICFGNLPYYASAQASWEYNTSACETIGSNDYYDGYCSSTRIHSCTISMNKSLLEESLTDFIHTLTHELGHCVGFLHNHDTHLSIMSYLANPDEVLRLQNDDKMGLVYLYPVDEDYNDESPTLGLTGCE